MRVIATLVAVAALGCLEPSTKVCGTLACPSDTACVALATNGPTCLPIAGCDRASTGDACDPQNGQEGTCEGGGCRPIERCGNGIVDSGETCDCGDTTVTPRAECNARNNSDVDPLSPCRGDCQLRTCGDEQLDATEQCEGTAIAEGLTCETFGYYDGELACSQLCIVDRSACSRRCGDGVLDIDHEYCDPLIVDVAGYCTDFGYSAGRLRCGSSCGPTFQDCRAGRTFSELLVGRMDMVDLVRGPTPTSAWVLARRGLWLYDEATGMRDLGAPGTTTLLDVSSFGSRAVVASLDGQVYLYDATGTLIDTLTAPAPCTQIAMTAEDTFLCLGHPAAWWSAGTWEAPISAPEEPALEAIARPDGSVLYSIYGGSTGLATSLGDKNHALRATRTMITGMNGWSGSLQTFHEITDGSGATAPGLYGGLAYGGAGYGMVKLDPSNTWNLAMGTEDYLQVENVGGRQLALMRYTRGEGAILSNRVMLSIDQGQVGCKRIVGTGTTALCLPIPHLQSSGGVWRFAGASVSHGVNLALGADTLADAIIDDQDVMYYVGSTGANANTSPTSSWAPPSVAGVNWDRLAGARDGDVLAVGRSNTFYQYLALWSGSAWSTQITPHWVMAAIPLGNGEVLASVYRLNGACDLMRGPLAQLVVIESLTFCPTSLWASPTMGLWGAASGIVRDLSGQRSWSFAASPPPTTSSISGRDDSHVWYVAGRQIWFFDGTSWTEQLSLDVPTDFDWVSANAHGVIATARKPTPTTWLLHEDANPRWMKLRLPSDFTAMIEPVLRAWGVVFRAPDNTLRYSVWEDGWPQ